MNIDEQKPVGPDFRPPERVELERQFMEKTVSRTFNAFEDFNVGDVVKLKSGGPNMTVDTVGGSRITCIWFDANNEWHSLTFDQGAIEKVTKDPDLSPA